ncbi:hypothetical protein AAE478_006249 [Parahypoxylon ruwenzoriense]
MAFSRESGTLGTYQRYKLGQAQFQKWLKQTSDKLRLGRSAKPATGPARPETPATKKGQNISGNGNQSKGDPKGTSAVHWSQLESMATDVIENSDPEQIPQSAISILRDVVYLRKKSARFFSSAASKSENETLKQKNLAHEHIIKVLEKILHRFDTALSKIIGPSAAPSPAREDRHVSMNDINNMFEYLKVEESHDGDKEGPDEISDVETAAPKRGKKLSKKSGKKQKQKKQPKEQRSQKHTTATQDASWVDTFQWVDEDEEEDDFDYYMLIYCFFQDFNSIRTYVCDRWTEYFYDKSVSLNTLAVVTNAACEIFHEMEYELEKTLKDTPQLADYGFMLQMLFYQYGLDHVDYSGEDELTHSERNYKIFGEADWLGFPAYTHVLQLLEFIPPGKVPMIPPSTMKRPKYGPQEFDDYRHFTKDVVFELFPECCLLKAMKKNGELPATVSAQDELTLDFEHIFRLRDCPSSFVFGLSLYIDIRYILEDQVIDAFNLLQSTAARMKTTLEDHLPNIKGPWDLKRDCRDRLAELEVAIIDDFLLENKTERFREKGVTETLEHHFLLKIDPIWSGLLDFRCQLVLDDLGYRLINEASVVLGAVFIYAASRLSGTPDLHWPQMDRFLTVHKEDRILQDVLSTQLSPVDLLKKFVDRHLPVAESGPANKFANPSKAHEALYQRYAWDSGSSRLSMGYLHEIIQDKFDVKAGYTLSRQAVPPSPETNSRDKEAHNSAGVSPVQLLEILDETTTSLLENQLSIDYFLLHEESMQLFRELMREFSPEVKKDAPILLDENTRTDKLILLLPVIYRSLTNGNTEETTNRLTKVTAKVCAKVP